MTLEELVGRQLVVGFSGTALDDAWAEHLRALRIRGVIPFARNCESPDQFRALLAQIREAVGGDLLVMIDHEGGRWVRFASGVTRFPDALTTASTKSPDAAYEQGRTEAAELRSLGIHVNLAPCVDVLVDGSDPIIGSRSYGKDPQTVAAFATARIRGLQEHGASACAKHFPGLGAVPNDPHVQLPTLQLGWDAMRATHLPPFVAASQAGVASVMSSHVCYPLLDRGPRRPATFSPRLIRDLLRLEMNFGGAIISDDLEMGALRDLFPMGETAVRTVEAGHDVLLICAQASAQREAFEALCAAYRSGRLSVKELERSVERIDTLRRQVSASRP